MTNIKIHNALELIEPTHTLPYYDRKKSSKAQLIRSGLIEEERMDGHEQPAACRSREANRFWLAARQIEREWSLRSRRHQG